MANKGRVEKEMPTMNEVQNEPKQTYVEPVKQEPSGPVNCLRNERVIVRFVASPNALVRQKGHVLDGGMSERAFREFVVPRLQSTGAFKNVLTNNEKAFLEQIMGLEYNALSVYRKADNFWSDNNPYGIGKVRLYKQDNFLDLSNPEDYIKYKILLANEDYIAPSLQALEEAPKATYQFVIISENAEASANLSRNEGIMKCYEEYGAIRNDADTLRVLLELLSGRPLAPQTKLDFLQGKVIEYIQKDPRNFLRFIQDELLSAKVLIKKCLDRGIISKRNDAYYLTDGDKPLCELNQESTLDNAARYITSTKRSELKYTLEAKVKD